MEEASVSKKEIVVEGLINYALSEVERKYGTGQGDGENPKKFHNRPHSESVRDATENIAQLVLDAGKITASDIPLIRIAASFHDIEQDLGRGLNESESARITEAEMRKTGAFTEEDIQKVERMILATNVSFENGSLRQSATDEYPTQIIADADLAHLGKEPDIYWETARNLLKELKGTDAPSRENEIAFAQGNLTLLENYRFYTEEATRLFPYRQQNIEFTQEHIESLVSEGQVVSSVVQLVQNFCGDREYLGDKPYQIQAIDEVDKTAYVLEIRKGTDNDEEWIAIGQREIDNPILTKAFLLRRKSGDDWKFIDPDPKGMEVSHLPGLRIVRERLQRAWDAEPKELL
ncbi:hypothetical protein A2470_00885 [Candidatus Curtissbacteria bacterium RIFOXYC2_FULL_41_11]|nr:MAG: hypothetical protein A2470_00885 [Candidatus Curtissbacteria bacterium RIFOXYC2_FULL_41_11]